MNTRFVVHASTVLALAAVACGSSSESEDPSSNIPDQTLVRDIVLEAGPDGALVAKESWVTMGERRAQAAARASRGAGPTGTTAQPLVTTGSCADGRTFWAYSGASMSGDRLCLMGTADGSSNVVNLSSVGAITICDFRGVCFTVPGVNWDGKIASFYSGSQPGILSDWPATSGKDGVPSGLGGGPSLYFSAYQYHPTVPFAASALRLVGAL